MNSKNNFVQTIILLIFTLLTTNSCTKDNNDVVPNVYVNIDVYLSDPLYVSLNAVGSSVYVAGGVKGIILYRRSNDEFVAYERNCTYQPLNSCAKVSVDAANNTMIDTCCGSKFRLVDGTVTKGPAARPLKEYQYTYNSTNAVVHIYNE